MEFSNVFTKNEILLCQLLDVHILCVTEKKELQAHKFHFLH
jgi:hypothetical protein